MFLKLVANAKYAVSKYLLEPPRSNKWPKVEKAHLLKEPTCMSCGGNKRLNVHHKMPFHLNPEIELDPDNLLTLCMGNLCHIWIGHGDNFKKYNPDVESDAARVRSSLPDFESTLAAVAKEAKEKRLPA